MGFDSKPQQARSPGKRRHQIKGWTGSGLTLKVGGVGTGIGTCLQQSSLAAVRSISQAKSMTRVVAIALTPSYRLDRGKDFEWVPDPINFCVIKFAPGRRIEVKKEKK